MELQGGLVELQIVNLEKTDTCLTYALKRAGLSPDLCSYDTMHEHFNLQAWSRYKNKLKVGDIVLWDKDSKHEWLPWKINGLGVEWKNVPVGFHFAIYEGNYMFSDCSRTVVPPHPTLRLRNMKDLHKNPDWVLVYDNTENND
tara:strand:- start:453 stop:881 length:429 start_codon:yes stop_codon:yes gene_type:complete